MLTTSFCPIICFSDGVEATADADGVNAVKAATIRPRAATRECRAAMPVMHPGRVDVIGAGALILRVIMDVYDLAEVVVSEHDILDGIALRLARTHP